MLRFLSVTAALVFFVGCSFEMIGEPQTSTLTVLTLASPDAVADSVAMWVAEEPGLSTTQSPDGRLVVAQEGRLVNRATVNTRSRTDGLTEVRVDYAFQFVPGQTRTLPTALVSSFAGRGSGVLPLPVDGSPPCQSIDAWREETSRVPDPNRVPDPDAEEEQPVLIGGLEGMQQRVRYPEMLRRAGIEGVVIVGFEIDEAGVVDCARVLMSPHPDMSEAALDAVRPSRFQPGKQGGRPVRIRFTVPISFALR